MHLMMCISQIELGLLSKIYPGLKECLETREIRKIILSKNLSQLGDFLTNYVYSLMRIGVRGKNGAIHVWDKSLAFAAKNSELKQHFPSRTKTDGLADGVEALIAFVYLNGIMNLNEMVVTLEKGANDNDFINSVRERRACGEYFELLIREIITRTRQVIKWNDEEL